jgi:hypothetical protein
MKATITKKIADLLDKTVTISNSVHTQVTENDWRKLAKANQTSDASNDSSNHSSTATSASATSSVVAASPVAKTRAKSSADATTATSSVAATRPRRQISPK